MVPSIPLVVIPSAIFDYLHSLYHATLVQLPKDDNTFYYRIVDGNLKGKPSANGMLINGRKVPAHDLKNEDEIVFWPSSQSHLLPTTAGCDQSLTP